MLKLSYESFFFAICSRNFSPDKVIRCNFTFVEKESNYMRNNWILYIIINKNCVNRRQWNRCFFSILTSTKCTSVRTICIAVCESKCECQYDYNEFNARIWIEFFLFNLKNFNVFTPKHTTQMIRRPSPPSSPSFIILCQFHLINISHQVHCLLVQF